MCASGLSADHRAGAAKRRVPLHLKKGFEMDEMTRNMISCCLRYIIYSHAATIFALYLLNRACGLKRPGWGRIGVIIELRLAATLWILEIMGSLWGEESWYPLFVELANLLQGAGAVLVMTYFQGHLGKTLLACLWMECFAVGCEMGAWALAYQGTGMMFTMTGQPLYLRDVLAMGIYVPICALCTLALAPVLRFCRNYEFRHPRLLLGLMLVVVFGRGHSINLFSAVPQGTYRLTQDMIFGEMALFLLAVFAVKQARLRNQVYGEQQRSVEAHLTLLREQAAQAAGSREVLEERIALLESLPLKERTALAGQYLTELREQYNDFLAQVRCRDPLVDALLSYRQILCEKKGISTEFSFENYSRGVLGDQEIAALLLCLFDWAVENCVESGTPGHIALSAALVKGQMLVEMSCGGKRKLTRGSLRPLLARRDGILIQERTEDGWRVRVLLDAE